MKIAEEKSKLSWEERFVGEVIRRCKDDKGLAARLRRADNPATEYQSWDLLASLGVDLEKDYQRLPFALIGSAISKAKAERNGTLPLGRVLAQCYPDDRESGPAKMRLRRLLACDDLAEVCRILRPVFTLIDSKSGQPIDYIRLLRQLRSYSFPDNRNRIKAQWAQEFYGQTRKSETPEEIA